MDIKDLGRVAKGDQALPPSAPEPSGLRPSGNDPSRCEALLDLIGCCEGASEDSQGGLVWSAGVALRRGGDRLRDLIAVGAYFDAALILLPAGAVWRKFTDGGCSVYAGSPFNAAAQVRYDGHTSIDSLSLCAAILRLAHAHAAKASAIEARRAATGTGAVHESAARQGDAQSTPGTPHE